MSGPRPGDGLLRPTIVVAIAVLAFNDHVLKDVAPGLVSGKLSDVAGLVVLPVVLQAVVETFQGLAGRYRGPSDRLLGWCCLVAAAGLALVNTSPPVEGLWQATWGWLQLPARSIVAGGWVAMTPVSHTADVTDLLTLPAAILPLVTASARARRTAITSGAGSPIHGRVRRQRRTWDRVTGP